MSSRMQLIICLVLIVNVNKCNLKIVTVDCELVWDAIWPCVGGSFTLDVILVVNSLVHD